MMNESQLSTVGCSLLSIGAVIGVLCFPLYGNESVSAQAEPV